MFNAERCRARAARYARLAIEVEAAFGMGEHRLEFLFEQSPGRGRGLRFSPANTLDNTGRGGDADIGTDKSLFHRLPELGIEGAAPEHTPEGTSPSRPGLAQAAPNAD